MQPPAGGCTRHSGRLLLPRTLGESGPLVSALGLGTMSWPGCRYGSPFPNDPPAAGPEVVAMVEAALEQGINLIDTAEGYGCGFAETHLGFAIREIGCRHDICIVTKTGPLFGDEQVNRRTCNLSRAHLHTRVDAALKRLGVDRIDVLLAHWPDDQTPIEETMAAVRELKAAGKIAHFGVSNFSASLLASALAEGTIVCNQLPCSLADRSIDDGRRQFCLEHRIGIMAYSPLGKGILAGKYTATELPPAGDYRLERPHFSRNLQRNLRIAERLRSIAAKFDSSPAAVALAWAVNLPGITVVLPGAKSPVQVRDNARAASLLDSPEVLAELETLSTEFPG